MSTSGVSSWSLQRDAVINAALRKLVVLSGGSPAETYQVTNAAEALNAMIKSFQADGMPVWAIVKYTFTTQTNVPSYNIGSGQTLDTPVPLKVVQATRYNGTGANVPMNVYTNYDYNLLPQNNNSGPPVNLYYQPFPTYGKINFDFPSYWTEALIWGLAWRLSGEYGIPIQDRQLLAKEAEMMHEQALSYGTEEGSLYIMPGWVGR